MITHDARVSRGLVLSLVYAIEENGVSQLKSQNYHRKSLSVQMFGRMFERPILTEL